MNIYYRYLLLSCILLNNTLLYPAQPAVSTSSPKKSVQFTPKETKTIEYEIDVMPKISTALETQRSPSRPLNITEETLRGKTSKTISTFQKKDESHELNQLLENLIKPEFIPHFLKITDSQTLNELMQAKRSKNYAIIKRLVFGLLNDSLLHIALRLDDIEYAQDLLKNIKNPKEVADLLNTPNGQVKTPLHIVTEKNYIELIRDFLNKGADPLFSDIKGQTPLFIAIKNNNNETVKTLLAHPSYQDPKAWATKTYNNETALDLAIRVGSDNIINQLIQKEFNMPVLNLQQAPLLTAIEINNFPIVKKLIDFGADKERKNINGFSPLHLAIALHPIFKDQKIIEYLLQQGVNINTANQYGITPLMTAMYNNDENLIKILLQHNADIEAMDSEGFTALQRAQDLKNMKMFTLLKKYGAREKNKYGQTLRDLQAQQALSGLYQ